MKKFFIEKFLPIRISLPFISKSIILIGDPKQIDEVVSSPNMHQGALSSPRVPAWINWIGKINFNFIACPVKKQAFVAAVSPEEDIKYKLNRAERITLHKQIPMMPQEDVDVLSEYLCDKRSKRDTQYHLICSMARNFTDLIPPEELVDLGEQMSKRMKSPWHYIRANNARKKFIGWCNKAGEKCTKIPPNVDPTLFCQNIVGDIYHDIFTFCDNRTLWRAIEALKEKFQEHSSPIIDPKNIVESVLLSAVKPIITILSRVAQVPCHFSTLPYAIKTGDTVILLMYIARNKAKNLHYTFLGCCEKNYVCDFMLRAVIGATALRPV